MSTVTSLRVEIINSKRQVKRETWSRGTNSRVPFAVNVKLNLSNVMTHNESFKQGF